MTGRGLGAEVGKDVHSTATPKTPLVLADGVARPLSLVGLMGERRRQHHVGTERRPAPSPTTRGERRG